MRSGRPILALLGVLFVVLFGPPVRAAKAAPATTEAQGTVTLPLARLRALEGELDGDLDKPEDSPVLWLGRNVEGRFQKGLWTGRLTARFEVLSGAPTKIPVLFSQAVIGEVTLDGEPASLLEDGASFVLPLEAQNKRKHELSVDFHWGRESQRFTRTLRLLLPEGGPISVDARIAELGITPNLSSGAIVRTTEQGGETWITARLDGAGELGLSWKRSDPDGARGEASLEAREQTLFHVTDALVTGRSVVTARVLSGETDELKFVLPRGVEVLRAEGDAVLQWHTQARAGDERSLVVLLRHLVSDEAVVNVDFQLSDEPGALVSLAMPMFDGKVNGVLGIAGPPGLRLDVKSVNGAEPLAARDVPAELGALARGPLLFGYRWSNAPSIVVAASSLPELELSRTVVDELSASTVLCEDGTERTKVALRIRNDGRQYVELSLPEGARPMRSFIDGREVRPALLGRRLLLPLRQSERLAENQTRIHVVRAGETLSDVANLYYSDPSAWQRIVAKNRDVVDASGVLVRDTRLQIPPAAEASKEAFFVIEVSYERQASALSAMGFSSLRLPGLDVDTTKAVWHVYLPASHEPLSFQGNLTLWSRIKYDPLRRLEWYLESALSPTNAYAGGDYENILSKRRAIYDDEASREGETFAARSTFPLVGERYRFRRVLLGREVAEIRMWYASNALLTVVRYVAAALVFAAALFALRRGGRARFALLALLVLSFVAVAHFVPGLHRRIVWGLDLALLVAIASALRPRLSRLARALARAPWLVSRMVTTRRIVAAAGFTVLLGELVKRPMLLSLALLVLFSIAWARLSIARKNRRPSRA